MDALIDFLAQYGYLGLFVSAFLSATVLPFSSEAIFTGLLYAADVDVWRCIWAATIGNALGAFTCYLIGRLGKIEWMEKYLHIEKETLDKWVPRVRKYSYLCSFCSFVPIIGDVLAVASGYIRAKALPTFLCLFLGKFVRYVVWVAVTYWVPMGV